MSDRYRAELDVFIIPCAPNIYRVRRFARGSHRLRVKTRVVFNAYACASLAASSSPAIRASETLLCGSERRAREKEHIHVYTCTVTTHARDRLKLVGFALELFHCRAPPWAERACLTWRYLLLLAAPSLPHTTPCARARDTLSRNYKAN